MTDKKGISGHVTTHFEKSLSQSLRDTRELPLGRLLKELFPSLAAWTPTRNPRDDIDGSDGQLFLSDGRRYHIDLKFRTYDPLRWSNDDLAIELWSVLEKRIPGYRNKKTDYIVWVYKDTLRTVAVPFRPFQRRIAEKRQMLARTLPNHTQVTEDSNGNSFHSQHVFVPTWLFSDILIEPHPTFKRSA